MRAFMYATVCVTRTNAATRKLHWPGRTRMRGACNGPSRLTIRAVAAAGPERVNDFAPPFVMNLLRKAVMISG